MINYIEGKLTLKDEGLIVVECNGIGYEIFASETTINSLPFINERCKILTYLQVKEDGMALFGFATREEKDMFLKLISINGIGPKMAVGVLSGIKLPELITAIYNQDIKLLCTIKGLGKKTAERVLLELKDQVFSAVTPIEASFDQSVVEDATEALIALGVGKNEAYRLAKENAGEGVTVEEIITKALRGMGS